MFKCIPDKDFNQYLQDTFKKPCEDMFGYMAKNQPNYLIALLTSGELKDTDLTFAAEIAGCFIDDAKVLIPLAILATSDSDLVHEGAVRGITAWGSNHDNT
jgi:hypothetical protein